MPLFRLIHIRMLSGTCWKVSAFFLKVNSQVSYRKMFRKYLKGSGFLIQAEGLPVISYLPLHWFTEK